MPCPICDQKAANCDCTETELRQHEEMNEAEARIAALEARVREVETERDRLLEDSHNAYTKSVEERTKLLSMNYEQGGEFRMDMTVAHEVMLRFVESARVILDKAENYVEAVVQELNPADGAEGYVMTIQRRRGKTPHQKRVEAESALAAARAEIADLRAGELHSCHAECQRSGCVTARELRATIAELVDGLKPFTCAFDWGHVDDCGHFARAAALVARLGAE